MTPDASTNHSHPYQLKQMFNTALVCLVVSILIAAIKVAFNNGFGIRDLWSFVFWSIPFALGITSINLTGLYCRLPLPLRYLMAITMGVIIGILWASIVQLFLGSWFGSFSFPVLICWVAGGTSGMIIAARTCIERKGRIWSELVLVGVICLLATAGTEPLSVWSSGDQRMSITFIKWMPGPQPLSMQDVSDFEDYGLTGEDINRLASLGLTGQLNALSGSRTGKGIKHSHVLVVMQLQLDKPSVDLAQPNGLNVIYVQDENNNWHMYPSNTPTLQRNIRLEIPKNKANVTEYWVDLAGGARQGGQAFFWE